jgi:hypothetical protein
MGQLPAATSTYVTETIPQPSLVLPRLVAFSKTASLEAAKVAENTGPVTSDVEQPSILLVTAQDEIVGDTVSST